MGDNKTLTNRLETYIDYKKMDVWDFERRLELTKGVLYNAIKKNTTIGSDKLEIIITNCKDLNPAWLLTGDGDMIIKVDVSVGHSQLSIGNNNVSQNIRDSNIGHQNIGTNELVNEIHYLQKRISDLEKIIESKDEIIQLLKGK